LFSARGRLHWLFHCVGTHYAINNYGGAWP
jgi:hypothetical protein